MRRDRWPWRSASGWPWPPAAGPGRRPRGQPVGRRRHRDDQRRRQEAGKDPQQRPRLRRACASTASTCPTRRSTSRAGSGCGSAAAARRRRPTRPEEARGGPSLRRPDGRRRRRPPARPGGARRHGRLRQVHARARHRHARPDRRRPGLRKDDEGGPDPESSKFRRPSRPATTTWPTWAGTGTSPEPVVSAGRPGGWPGRRRRGGAGRGGLVDGGHGRERGGGQATGGEVATATAEVTRRDLRAQEEVDGTLGYGEARAGGQPAPGHRHRAARRGDVVTRARPCTGSTASRCRCSTAGCRPGGPVGRGRRRPRRAPAGAEPGRPRLRPRPGHHRRRPLHLGDQAAALAGDRRALRDRTSRPRRRLAARPGPGRRTRGGRRRHRPARLAAARGDRHRPPGHHRSGRQPPAVRPGRRPGRPGAARRPRHHRPGRLGRQGGRHPGRRRRATATRRSSWSSLDKPKATGRLDQAPVDASITTEVARACSPSRSTPCSPWPRAATRSRSNATAAGSWWGWRPACSPTARSRSRARA